jgi:hypothetical protein
MAGPFGLISGLGMLIAGLSMGTKPNKQPVKKQSDYEWSLKFHGEKIAEYRECVKKLEEFEAEPGHEYCTKINDRFIKEAVAIDLVRRFNKGEFKLKQPPREHYTERELFFRKCRMDYIENFNRFRIAGFTTHEVPWECLGDPSCNYFDEKWYAKDGETINDAIERMSSEIGIEVLHAGLITGRYTRDASKIPGYYKRNTLDVKHIFYR